MGPHRTFEDKLANARLLGDEVGIRRPRSGAVAPYATEQIEYRDVDQEAFYERLRRNGPRAYAEFKRAEGVWSTRG